MEYAICVHCDESHHVEDDHQCKEDKPTQLKDMYFRCCGAPQDMGHMFGCPLSVERQPKDRTESVRGNAAQDDKIDP
jgi:hypothetical protein